MARHHATWLIAALVAIATGACGGSLPASAPVATPHLRPSLGAQTTPSASPNKVPSPTSIPSPGPSEAISTPVPTATASETSPEPPRTKNFLDIVEYYAAFDAGGVVKDASGDFQVRFSRALLDNAGIKGISVPSSDLQSIHDTTVHRAYRFTHKARGSELVLGWAHAVIFGRLDRIVAFSVTKEEDLNIRLALIANGLRTATTGSDRGTLYMSDDTLFVLLPPHERLLDGVPEDWNRQDAGFRISAEFGRAYYFPVEAAIEGENIDRGPPTFEGVDLFGLNETNNYGKDGATGRVTIDYY